MAITRAAGFPVDASGATVPSTVSVTPAKIGDLMILYVQFFGSASVATVAGGGVKVGEWIRLFANQNATEGQEELWIGRVSTVTGAAQPITTTYSGTVTGAFGDLLADSLTSGFGPDSVWNVVASNFAVNATNSLVIAYPSLTSSTSPAPQAYWGAGITGGAPSAGSTSGFSYSAFSSGDGELAWNFAPATNTALTPTAVTTSAGTYTAGMIVQATKRPSTTKSRTMQAVMRAALR